NSLVERLTPPMWSAGGSVKHPLGTDTLGRDVASRLLYGARVSLIVGLAAVVVAGVIGVALGLLSGYYRGWADDALMRPGDVQLAFPGLVLAGGALGVARVAVGLLSGYYGGGADDALMRLGDVQLAFPVLVLAVAVLAVLGASLANVILVLGVTGWITYARLVRGETLSLRQREIVEAARALGATE